MAPAAGAGGETMSGLLNRRTTRRTTRRGAVAAWMSHVGLTCVSVALLATGCASVGGPGGAPTEVGGPALQLADPEAWARFEVVHIRYRKRFSFRDFATGKTWESRYHGGAESRKSLINVVVPERVYERRNLRGKIRFQRPLDGQPLVLKARARSHSVHTVQVPTEEGALRVEIFDRLNVKVGELACMLSTRLLFAGELEGESVEIELLHRRTDESILPSTSMFASFPVDGEFVIWVAGLETARFLKRPPGLVATTYELALRQDAADDKRDRAALAFTAFVLAEELTHDADL